VDQHPPAAIAIASALHNTYLIDSARGRVELASCKDEFTDYLGGSLSKLIDDKWDDFCLQN